MNKYLQEYCSQMDEINSRLKIVRSVVEGKISTGNEVFDYEIICVNTRKVLEIIVLSSTIANKNLYIKNNHDHRKLWKPKQIMQRLEKSNSDFYPRPQVPGIPRDSIANYYEDVKSGYLTKDDLINLYELCGRILHHPNPLNAKKGRKINFEKHPLEWIQMIELLLGIHLMRGSSVNRVIIFSYPKNRLIAAFENY